MPLESNLAECVRDLHVSVCVYVCAEMYQQFGCWPGLQSRTNQLKTFGVVKHKMPQRLGTVEQLQSNIGQEWGNTRGRALFSITIELKVRMKAQCS